jgi:hypothetical protein
MNAVVLDNEPEVQLVVNDQTFIRTACCTCGFIFDFKPSNKCCPLCDTEVVVYNVNESLEASKG